uniref:Uncharacterized protein n=1 Tax=Rhizophora mucronata TaxID=61149 RepID=A0A2P2QFH2_RHIMU
MEDHNKKCKESGKNPSWLQLNDFSTRFKSHIAHKVQNVPRLRAILKCRLVQVNIERKLTFFLCSYD